VHFLRECARSRFDSDGVANGDSSNAKRDATKPAQSGVCCVPDAVEVAVSEPLGVLGTGNSVSADQQGNVADIDTTAETQRRPG
jgi:hypothetical protein